MTRTCGGPRPIDTDQAWRLRAGDLVVVDESAMTETAALAAIHGYADAAGAKLLLVGDHRQLAAVGAGGGMDLIAASGARYELAEARRFAHGWERDASLRLRAGDASVLREYHQQGRLLDSGTVEDAESSAARAWLADTLAGRRGGPDGAWWESRSWPATWWLGHRGMSDRAPRGRTARPDRPERSAQSST